MIYYEAIREKIIYYYDSLINNSNTIFDYTFDEINIYHNPFLDMFYFTTELGKVKEISKSEYILMLKMYMRRIKLEKICSKLEIKYQTKSGLSE